MPPNNEYSIPIGVNLETETSSRPEKVSDNIQKEKRKTKSSLRQPLKNPEIKLDRGTRREIDRIPVSEKETSSSRIRKKNVPNSRKDEPKSLVLILPKYSPKTNPTDTVHIPEPVLAFNGNLKANEIDHATTESGAVKENFASPSRRFSFNFGKISRNSSIKEISAFPGPIKSEPSHRYSPNFLQIPTGKDTKEEPIKKSSEDVIGNISPNRRFGFSIGKMKRNFSYKESSNISQSSPLRFEVSDYSNTPKENKNNLHSKSRSSPLRRLLDPIFKAKATNSNLFSEKESFDSTKLKQNSISFSENELFGNKKPRESTVQALLQTTTKNGLPLFKLVVNNSCDIIVAMKNKIPSGKQDFDSIYTFYAVHEIKKNKSSSWINQIHKEKNLGFGYNVVGQMKGFSRICNEKNMDKFENQILEKEFVLCSVEAPELVPMREIASIIVRFPKSNNDGEERNIGKELTGKDFLEYLEDEKYLFRKGETEKFYSTTVLLSDGDHGFPNNGVPWSLIQRWRSGGSCDCGGWDVGCKIEILTNEKKSEPSDSCSIQDRFDLFNQGGARYSKPIFTLAPYKKGIYSIEFSTSISLLQALSICIAAISSRQSFDFSEINSEEKLLED